MMRTRNGFKLTTAILAMAGSILTPSECKADIVCSICPFETAGVPYSLNNAIQNQIDPNDPYCSEPGVDCSLPDSHHEVMMRRFEDDNSWSPGDVAFIGGSNTSLMFLGIPDGTLPENFHNFGVAADNIGGSNDVISRLFLQQPVSKPAPSKLFIHIDASSMIQFFESGCFQGSGNDRGIQAADSAMCQFDVLIDTLLVLRSENPGLEIYLQPVLPLGDPADSFPSVISSMRDVIDASDILNQYIEMQADAQGFTFVDIHDDFLDFNISPVLPNESATPGSSTHRMDPAFSREYGLHLNIDGYRRWMGKLSPYFARDISSGSDFAGAGTPPGDYITIPPSSLGLQLWSSEDQRYYWSDLTVPPNSTLEIKGDSGGNNMLAVMDASTLEIENSNHVELPYYIQTVKGNDVEIIYDNPGSFSKDIKMVYGLDEDGFSDYTLGIRSSVSTKKGTRYMYLLQNMVQKGNTDSGFHTSEGDPHVWMDIDIPAGQFIYGFYASSNSNFPPAIPAVKCAGLYSDHWEANSSTRLYGTSYSTGFFYRNNSSQSIKAYLLLELNTDRPDPSDGYLRIY